MSIPATFTRPNPSQTASRASSYVPPLAGTTSATGTTIAATSAINPNPTTPPFQDDHQWITAYLTIHQLSTPSYRYMYILWLAVVLIFLVFAVLHWTGRRCGALGGLWSKWSLRRRTWRKEHGLAEARRQNKPHKQPLSLPSNAQLLSLAVLYIATLLLCFLGPDYIAPGTHVWDLTHNVTALDPSVHLHSRTDRVPTTATTSQPGYTIPKAWWTAGGRTGTMAFALFPLCVLFALKSPPFALFALPFLIQIYNDKLAFLHRWAGRLIWFVVTLHIALWGVQLSRDKRGADNLSSVWSFAFEYEKFVFGWLGFICLTLLVALSLRPVRNEFYETFYILHVLLIPLTLAFSALHYPPIGWWCWTTLALWVAERLWRLIRFLRVNGLLGGLRGRRNTHYIASINDKAPSWGQAATVALRTRQKGPTSLGHTRDDSNASQNSEQRPILPTETGAMDVTEDGMYGYDVQSRPCSIGQETVHSFQTGSSVELMCHAASPGIRTFQSQHGLASISHVAPTCTQYNSRSTALGRSSRATYTPPPGYAHATLLPGRTIRLRLIPPHHFTWAPGQHVLLCVPSVSKFSSHPFTIASICDSEAMSDQGREVVILVRARTGFTKDLWSHIEQLEEARMIGDMPTFHFSPPTRGVLLRAYIDGPFGSSIRARWTTFSTILVIAGGSGVSFAAAVLEYACMCMLGRNGKLLGGKPGSWGHDTISQISRVRFIWIVREFSHIQWVASIIRRCMDMVPTSALQVDIFVTNAVTRPVPALAVEMHSPQGNATDTLAPPTPHFARPGKSRRNSNASDISIDSTISSNTFADVSYMRAAQTESAIRNDVVDIVDMYGELGHEEHVLDLTNFDGEDDTHLPGETQLSYRLRKEGKLRRARTRKSQITLLAKQELDHHAVETNTIALSPQGYLYPEYASPTVCSSTPPVALPTVPIGLRYPATNGLLSPSSANEPLSVPISPHVSVPPSFLYSEVGDASLAPLNKSDAFIFHDTETKHNCRNTRHSRTQSKLGMDEAEAEDMPIVAEKARPGRAKIDRIIADEAERSRGAMVVACCGPTSLNAVVRKCVAAQIAPSRIHRGDTRASIALVSEDFEW